MKALLRFITVVAFAGTAQAANLSQVQTVFVIVMENHDWPDFRGNPNAPYINSALLPIASFCEQYYNPPALHPSEPNYLWMEAGTNFSIFDNNDPAINHQHTTNHLVAQLRAAGISWKTYQEDITGTTVPLTSVSGYRPKHNPFVFFDDVTGTNNPNDPYGIAHNRPYTELANDLASNNIARYNFITPNQCDSGHDTCGPQNDAIRQIDDWLAAEIPQILASAAYSNNGAIFITWDEGEGSDGPIGMMVISPLVRGGGYFNNIHYTHSSFLRTMQEIFNVGPLLGNAANATSLSDLFVPFAIAQASKPTNGAFHLTVTGVVPARTNYVETSINLTNWTVLSTNVSATNNFSVQDVTATNHGQRFYRIKEVK